MTFRSLRNSSDYRIPVSLISFYSNRVWGWRLRGRIEVRRWVKLEGTLLSPQVYSIMLSTVWLSMLWQEVTSWDSRPRN